MGRKRATIMSLIPKVIIRNPNLIFFNKANTFRTAAADGPGYPTQPNTNSRGSSEGGGVDFQQTTGGGEFHNRTQNHYRGNPNDYVQNNPNRFYQNVSHKTPNSSSYYQNTDNHFRSFQQNQNGHYRRNNSAPRGPNEFFSSRKHARKPNAHPQTVKNVNHGQFQKNQNGLHSEMNNGESVSKVKCNATLEEMDGFCNEGNVKEAMRVLNLLYQQGIDIGLPRYCQLMKVIGEVGAKEEATLIHNHLMKTELHSEITVQNKVLEMYLKCGLRFGTMPARNLTSWDTMIVGLAENGCGEDAIDVFSEFKESGGTPDGQMFLGVLYACSTLCDINEGMLHFESMSKVYGIAPSMDHYVGVVKMLGIWETLMNLCRIHGKLETADLCANVVADLDPSRLSTEAKAGLVLVNPSDHVIAEKRKKYPGHKPFGLRDQFHQYTTGDTSHPDNDIIYAHLETLSAHMKESGYIPVPELAMHDVDDESKAKALLAHSEKLACITGLLSSPARSQMRIVKNCKVCADCHNAFKLISKIVGRRIWFREAKRWHHFEDGACSCNDWW
ncbi:hypothetical protein MKW94_025631 [Papaver nudicaule]|uniref:DYW domain-containing protein n=1 Tax=Papaver nudicaule TaxID=74823 RepID=A0AA41S6J3_PAPNU|nr:hypothetical protein [Papaver nudicaule]